ncbi:MAG: SWIM zinc finger family protein [Chloroflexi bacterium]|nr:SWIM zinc finger family protein [Chloroflexota bacterium]
MARRGWNDYSWGYYPKTTARPVKDGIKAKSQRGAIGETWWSKRWVEVLESFNIGARLGRGRSYARRGQVISIDVAPGVVKAQVQGSQVRPYKIDIRLATLPDGEWERVIDAMAARAIFAAKLLAGEMPTDIEAAFKDARVSLFPARESDLKTDCSCPDWSNPCKHIAAVYYILAEQFDADPFLIFKLRGRTKEQIIAALRARRTAQAPAVQEDASEATYEVVHTDPLPTTAAFWLPGADLTSFSVQLGVAQTHSAVLKQLGDAPFDLGRRSVADLLTQAYATVAQAAVEKALSG